ncbi:MAG: SgcJ/EcaC family oxidoreductase [Thermoguttaceae bacterium]
MRSILTMAGMAIALVAMAVAIGPQTVVSGDSPAKPAAATAASAPGAAHQQDEKAIRLAAEAFAKAYNRGDAKAIASLFATDGEIVNEEGQSTQGREGIERVFAGIFKENPKTHMDLAIGSIRFIGPDAAVEDGMATVTDAPDEPAQRNPYTVVHTGKDGKWLMASARDLPDDTPTPEEQLKQLQWMIGEWVDESPEALVITSYRWTDNQCYILSEFKVQTGGRPLMTGTQRIGWDPLAKKIRSWVFDSEGGFGEGIWTPEGNQWIVKMTGVTRDGKVASSTNITTRVSKHRMTWQSRDRIIGGEKTPDIAEIPITQKPPPPL